MHMTEVALALFAAETQFRVRKRSYANLLAITSVHGKSLFLPGTDDTQFRFLKL